MPSPSLLWGSCPSTSSRPVHSSSLLPSCSPAAPSPQGSRSLQPPARCSCAPARAQIGSWGPRGGHLEDDRGVGHAVGELVAVALELEGVGSEVVDEEDGENDACDLGGEALVEDRREALSLNEFQQRGGRRGGAEEGRR
eukprot:763997-Hanusia_phi.AAC.8